MPGTGAGLMLLTPKHHPDSPPNEAGIQLELESWYLELGVSAESHRHRNWGQSDGSELPRVPSGIVPQTFAKAVSSKLLSDQMQRFVNKWPQTRHISPKKISCV